MMPIRGGVRAIRAGGAFYGQCSQVLYWHGEDELCKAMNITCIKLPDGSSDVKFLPNISVDECR